MPSPDLIGLTDLVLYDRTPDELSERALLDVATKMPDWEPRAGDTAVVLIEALSLIVAEQVFAINRLPSATIDVLLQLFQITRSTGVAPTVPVTFATTTGRPLDIPGGSTIRLTLDDGSTLDFTTDVPASGPGPSLTVATTAVLPTDAANGIVAGTPAQVISPLPAVDSAVLAGNVAAGAAAEDEITWRTRGMQVLSRLTSTLVAATQFTAAALTNPLVYRATSLDDNNDGVTVAGHITVAVLGINGAVLSGPDKTALQTALAGQAQGNLAVHVIDPTVTPVAVTATVHALAGYSSAQVQANVMAALTAYLSPNTWPWSATVRQYKLIQIIEDAEGVAYLQTISAPSADVALSGVAPLASFDTGDSAITVT